MSAAKREVEIKFRVSDEEEMRHRLTAAGAWFEVRLHEENFFFDDAGESLRLTERVLRLRRSTSSSGEPGGDARLTYKEPIADPRFKVRREMEVIVDDADAMRLILEGLGLRCGLHYEKERELWHWSEVLVTLDTLSFGRFVELEGQPDALEATAKALGFDLRDGITDSYLTLAEKQLGD